MKSSHQVKTLQDKQWNRSNEPIWWSLFGAGGVVVALILPAVILITGILIPLGLVDPHFMSYVRMQGFASHWLGGLIVFAVIVLPTWHAAHRIYHLSHDLMLKPHQLYFILCYGLAFVITIAAGTLLLVV